jgi:hypothetical protein
MVGLFYVKAIMYSGLVKINTISVEITNKMQPYNRIYYLKIL